MWVANTQDDTVSRIDPGTAVVRDTIRVGRRPTGVAVGEGAVWVANSLSGTVSRIDPRTGDVEATVEVGEAPQSVTVAHGLVWVSVQQRAAPERSGSAARWRCARLLVPADPGPPIRRSTPTSSASAPRVRCSTTTPIARTRKGRSCGPEVAAGTALGVCRRAHVRVQGAPGVPLLAALERARDRRSVRTRDRARPHPRMESFASGLLGEHRRRR